LDQGAADERLISIAVETMQHPDVEREQRRSGEDERGELQPAEMHHGHSRILLPP